MKKASAAWTHHHASKFATLFAGSVLLLFLALYVVVVKVVLPIELPAKLVRATGEGLSAVPPTNPET